MKMCDRRKSSKGGYMAVVRCRCVQRIMGRSKDEWLEGRKAMWIVEGRQRLERMSERARV